MQVLPCDGMSRQQALAYEIMNTRTTRIIFPAYRRRFQFRRLNICGHVCTCAMLIGIRRGFGGGRRYIRRGLGVAPSANASWRFACERVRLCFSSGSPTSPS